MTQSDNHEMQELDTMLEELQQDPPDVPAALMERVMMDAERSQPRPVRIERRKGAIQLLLDGLGGWPALGGLAAASCVGFWIGISPPEGMIDPSGFFLPTDIGAYYDPAELTGFGWDIQEG